jgi:hypothetical protein
MQALVHFSRLKSLENVLFERIQEYPWNIFLKREELGE